MDTNTEVPVFAEKQRVHYAGKWVCDATVLKVEDHMIYLDLDTDDPEAPRPMVTSYPYVSALSQEG